MSFAFHARPSEMLAAWRRGRTAPAAPAAPAASSASRSRLRVSSGDAKWYALVGHRFEMRNRSSSSYFSRGEGDVGGGDVSKYGIVGQYNPSFRRHRVLWDNGDVEWRNLKYEVHSRQVRIVYMIGEVSDSNSDEEGPEEQRKNAKRRHQVQIHEKELATRAERLHEQAMWAEIATLNGGTNVDLRPSFVPDEEETEEK